MARFGPDGVGEPVPAHCPEPVHQGNVLCPFGFWGLAGIVEQPVSTAAIVWHVTGDPLDVANWGGTAEMTTATLADFVDAFTNRRRGRRRRRRVAHAPVGDAGPRQSVPAEH